jgi:hypothetical protein
MKCRSNLGNVCVHSVQNTYLPCILLPKMNFYMKVYSYLYVLP